MIPNSHLRWNHLLALNELYKTGKTKKNIQHHAYIKKLIEKRLIKFKIGSQNTFLADNKYKKFYEEEHLNIFKGYQLFFIDESLPCTGKQNYLEEDILKLMLLSLNKNEIRKNVTTANRFSNDFFEKDAKYLKGNESLYNAVLKILEIPHFPEKEPKNHVWRLITDCINPTVIVLCENMDNLYVPDKFREVGVELWYVGGNNTAIVHEIDKSKLKLPLYYICDWDYDGLKIYSRLVEIMKTKDKKITLLTPKEGSVRLNVNSKHHKSKWKQEKPFSSLERSLFAIKQQLLIQELIRSDQYIQEEGQDLLELLGY